VNHLTPRKKKSHHKDLILNTAKIGNEQISNELETTTHEQDMIRKQSQQRPPQTGLGIAELSNQPSSISALHPDDNRNGKSVTLTKADQGNEDALLGGTGKEHAVLDEGPAMSSTLGQIIAINTPDTDLINLVPILVNSHDDDKIHDATRKHNESNSVVPATQKLLDYLSYCDNKG
jgi:hypothetical protein